MLLVLGAVTGDRLVAELRELDPHLVRGDPVRAVADHRPVAPARREPLRDRRRSTRRRASTCSIAAGRSRSACKQRDPVLGVPVRQLVGEREREQEAGRDLRVERLRRRDAHLHVAAVGRVEHAVGAVDQIAVAPVDDRQDGRAAGPGEVDRPVGVGGRAALADRDRRACRTCRRRAGSPRARSRARPRPSPRATGRARAASAAARLWPATAAVPCPITSDPPELARAQARAQLLGQRLVRQLDDRYAVALGDLSPQRLAERRRRLRDLLQEVVREVAAVDVAGRDLRRDELARRAPAARSRRRRCARSRRRCPRRARRAPRSGPGSPRGCRGSPASRRRGAGSSTSPRPARRARSPRRSSRRPRPT